jgi:hypothetical protein
MIFRRRFLRSSALLATSIASLIPHGVAKAEEGKLAKRLRDSVISRPDLTPAPASPNLLDPPKDPTQRYQWKTGIVTTTFWIGEKPCKRNPVPNNTSSWDPNWAQHYGGTDDPEPTGRANFLPATFVPGQNPFYIALPYNDVTKGTTKPEAPLVIPWYKTAGKAPGQTACKGRWIAIRFGDRVAYAQWEDCGPFRTDHWQYVFGSERPKPNLNHGAGLDVSPAVRDYLGMNDTDVTDWKFVDFDEVPKGPWALYGDNNTFVQLQRAGGGTRVAEARPEQITPAVSQELLLRPAVRALGEIFQPIR